MIENIELYEDLKLQLKHLSVDNNTSVSEWMLKGAYYVLNNDPDITITPVGKYSTYTMNIPSSLKEDIRSYVDEKNIKIRDFWIKVAELIIDSGGKFDN